MDYSSQPAFCRLRHSLGDSESKATYIFTRLWSVLGYSANSTGTAGLLPKEDAAILEWEFGRAIELSPGISGIQMLMAAGLLIPKGEDYLCNQFARANYELDQNYVAPSRRGQLRAGFIKLSNSAEKHAKTCIVKLPPGARLDEQGKQLESGQIEKAIRLINLLDGICGLPQRKPNEFEIGLIHDACKAINQFGRKAYPIAMRLYALRSEYLFPRSPSLLLKSFSDFVALACPVEGWQAYEKENQNH